MKQGIAIVGVLGALLCSMDAMAQSNSIDLDKEEKGFVILGREHLPDFTVLIDRENLSKAYDLELKESFLPKIIRAIEKDPF